ALSPTAPNRSRERTLAIHPSHIGWAIAPCSARRHRRRAMTLTLRRESLSFASEVGSRLPALCPSVSIARLKPSCNFPRTVSRKTRDTRTETLAEDSCSVDLVARRSQQLLAPNARFRRSISP